MALALAGAGVARLADWAALPEIARGTLVRVCPAYTVTSAGRVAPGPRRVRIALLAGPRPRHAGRLAPGRRRPHGRSSPARNAARSPRFLNSR